MRKPARSAASVSSLALAAGMIMGISSGARCAALGEGREARPPGRPTFSRDIAPILFTHCAPCHRPGQVAPFSLLDYAGVKKHATDIVKVTEQRYMPPWLPEPGYGEFAGNRRLATNEIDAIRQWVAGGTLEGAPADLPTLPHWTEGWQLGAPDLVVRMPHPYILGPDGRDLYRNFVIPLPLNRSRYVRAVEFQPGTRAVHHVRIKLDPTRQSRRLEGQDPEVGFGGMNVPAKFPPGHLLTWQPGKIASRAAEDLPWLLEKGSDIVLQLHLRRTGKPEPVQPVLGFYFTDRPPTQTPFLIGLIAELIDIPPGAADYKVQRTFTLPVDVDALAVLPHAHYLGKEVRAIAGLPDGAVKDLLWIKHWDFNWQDDYRFSRPVLLPKGTTITMQWTYDNSGANVRNPHHPPQRVTFGPQSTDEMGELWLQVLPRQTNDLAVLRREYQRLTLREKAAYYENALARDPDNASAHNELGKALGLLSREPEAFDHFRQALRLAPALPEPHYYLGLILLRHQQLPEAEAEFATTLRLDPAYAKAYNGLGLVWFSKGDLRQAEANYRRALRADPDDPVARDGLDRVSRAKAALETK